MSGRLVSCRAAPHNTSNADIVAEALHPTYAKKHVKQFQIGRRSLVLRVLRVESAPGWLEQVQVNEVQGL